MWTVYLDQNKWIDLARAYHGRSTDTALRDVVDFIQKKKAARAAVFPLSEVRYLETAKIRNHDRRERLGKTMWDLSGGYTLAPYREIIRNELDLALQKRFPEQVRPRPFSLLGRGASHAFGHHLRYALPDAFRQTLPLGIAASFESNVQELIEESFLTGVGPHGLRMPPAQIPKPSARFQEHLAKLNPCLSDLHPEKRDDALYAVSLMDILDLFYDAVIFHGISKDQFEKLTVEENKVFIEDLPTRRVELQLYRQVLKNPQLRPRPTDLNDWGGLGPAVAHCDVVVCEKHFTSLVQREGFSSRAVVFTDIRKLPETFED